MTEGLALSDRALEEISLHGSRPVTLAVGNALEQAPSGTPLPAPDRERGAAAHLVNLILRALDADRDLKTLDAWARHAGLVPRSMTGDNLTH